MKRNTFIILLIFLGALSLAAYFSLNQQSDKIKSGMVGKRLFEDLPLENISRITVHSTGGLVNLRKKENVWVVEEQLDYLADFTLITNLVYRLQEVKVGRLFEGRPDSVLRLGLASPQQPGVQDDNKGIQVELHDASDAVLLSVVLGKTRESTIGAGGGQYIRITDDPMIYLIDENFEVVSGGSFDWVRKNILNIPGREIEKITCRTMDGLPVYTLIRPEKDQWPVLEGVNSRMELSRSKLDDLLTALYPLSITGIAGTAADLKLLKASFTHTFEYRLYDGTVFRFTPGLMQHSGEAYHVLKAETLQKAPEAGTTDTSAEPQVKETPGATPSSQDPVYDRMTNWIFLIPQWKYHRFVPETEDLFEKM